MELLFEYGDSALAGPGAHLRLVRPWGGLLLLKSGCLRSQGIWVLGAIGLSLGLDLLVLYNFTSEQLLSLDRNDRHTGFIWEGGVRFH